MPAELPELTVPDATAWHAWLAANSDDSSGVWLTLAKKGATQPTTLVYDDALVEALCFGWIDGQVRRGDATFYTQRFTPRRSRSGWSRRNVDIAQRLIAEGRMQPRGLAEVERARADGRWDAAYAGPRTITTPADVTAAVNASPQARAMWDILTSQNRYAVLYRVEQAKRPETRARRIAEFVAMLERGETVHPQKRRLED